MTNLSRLTRVTELLAPSVDRLDQLPDVQR